MLRRMPCLQHRLLSSLEKPFFLAFPDDLAPVLSLVHADSMDEAPAFLERSPHGNQASLFTSSGAAARRFRYEAPAGNIGINIGVAAPMAYFPFSGWKDSFFGIMHPQGRDANELCTDKKIVAEMGCGAFAEVLSCRLGDASFQVSTPSS